jgi:hypothetical protein
LDDTIQVKEGAGVDFLGGLLFVNREHIGVCGSGSFGLLAA